MTRRTSFLAVLALFGVKRRKYIACDCDDFSAWDALRYEAWKHVYIDEDGIVNLPYSVVRGPAKFVIWTPSSKTIGDK